MFVRSLQLLSLFVSVSPSLAGLAPANTSSALECRCGVPQALTLPHANITDPEEAKGCASYKLIDARGTTEPQGVSTMFFPVIENILANKSGGVSLSVEYPAALNQNTTSGEDFVIDTITAGLLSCPQQTYALFGYSQGASLMLNVLARLNSRALEAVTSVILAGNPYRVPGKISNVDETAQHDSSSSVGMFAAQAIASNSSSAIPQLAPEVDRSGQVLDYCIEGDMVCAQNPNCQCPIPAGHLSYGLVESVQQTAFEHVVNRL